MGSLFFWLSFSQKSGAHDVIDARRLFFPSAIVLCHSFHLRRPISFFPHPPFARKTNHKRTMSSCDLPPQTRCQSELIDITNKLVNKLCLDITSNFTSSECTLPHRGTPGLGLCNSAGRWNNYRKRKGCNGCSCLFDFLCDTARTTSGTGNSILSVGDLERNAMAVKSDLLSFSHRFWSLESSQERVKLLDSCQHPHAPKRRWMPSALFRHFPLCADVLSHTLCIKTMKERKYFFPKPTLMDPNSIVAIVVAMVRYIKRMDGFVSMKDTIGRTVESSSHSIPLRGYIRNSKAIIERWRQSFGCTERIALCSDMIPGAAGQIVSFFRVESAIICPDTTQTVLDEAMSCPPSEASSVRNARLMKELISIQEFPCEREVAETYVTSGRSGRVSPSPIYNQVDLGDSGPTAILNKSEFCLVVVSLVWDSQETPHMKKKRKRDNLHRYTVIIPPLRGMIIRTSTTRKLSI